MLVKVVLCALSIMVVAGAIVHAAGEGVSSFKDPYTLRDEEENEIEEADDEVEH